MKSTVYTPDAIDEVAARILAAHGPGSVFALVGDLGAGKTTLVSALCRQLGVREPTSSPTFSIVNQYTGSRGPVYHLDAYRLRDTEEALAAGLEDVFTTGDDATIFVEWPQVLQPLLPSDVVTLRLAHTSDGAARRLTVSRGYAPSNEQ